MSAYAFNPDVCLQVLEEIAEEIPAGVSGHDLKAVYPELQSPQELLSYVRSTITSACKNDINKIWVRYNISEKLQHLEELLKKDSPKTHAWRPTTGKVDINALKAHNLLMRKEALRKQIELVREESAKITPYLQKSMEKYSNQLEEIQCIEKFKEKKELMYGLYNF